MIEYGVETSEAHYWLHVCPLDASFYFYSRQRMVKILSHFKEVRIKSAIGRLVPVIKNKTCNAGILHTCDLQYEFMNQWSWSSAPSDKAIGQWAEECFELACKKGLFRLPIVIDRYDDRRDQFKGKDYACKLPRPIIDVEIKGDILGGIWGTGNLFVQTSEGDKISGDKHQFNSRHAHKDAPAYLTPMARV